MYDVNGISCDILQIAEKRLFPCSMSFIHFGLRKWEGISQKCDIIASFSRKIFILFGFSINELVNTSSTKYQLKHHSHGSC